MLRTRIQSKIDTTAHWNAATTFIPLKGEVIVYSDYSYKMVEGNRVYIPNFKVGDGLAYVPDLPFVNEDMRQQLESHLLDTTIHVTSNEKNLWNEKVTCYISSLDNEELIFTKN